MKRFIFRRNPKYHEAAALRIMDEVLTHINPHKLYLTQVFLDIKALMRSGPGVYYVTTKLPKNANVGCSQTHNYFYRFRVITKKKRVQTFLIPRNPLF